MKICVLVEKNTKKNFMKNGKKECIFIWKEDGEMLR